VNKKDGTITTKGHEKAQVDFHDESERLYEDERNGVGIPADVLGGDNARSLRERAEYQGIL